jgi:rsbT co-antagonist protein RsbR
MASRLPEILRKHESEILSDWLAEQAASLSRDTKARDDTRELSRRFLALLADAVAKGNLENVDAEEYREVRALLVEISRQRSVAGFSPRDTAMFVFSLKKPLFARLRKELNGEALSDELWNATVLLDQLGLITTEAFQKTREEIIERQQQDMLELSTPVVKLWRGILALPMIGTLDSGRTQIVMESLLQKITETEADVAILDITGVPTVDTLVAQHLLKTVAAARLMGADCIISGVRPQIAQTMVHLAIDMGNVTTKASLADAFAHALKRQGLTLVRAAKA